MLNVFPDLLSFSLFGPFILRLALGVFFLHSGYGQTLGNRALVKNKYEKLGLKPGEAWATLAGLMNMALALLLIFGAFTQVAALLSLIICLFLLTLRLKDKNLVSTRTEFLLLLTAISLSLLLQGAGALALDLPL